MLRILADHLSDPFFIFHLLQKNIKEDLYDLKK